MNNIMRAANNTNLVENASAMTEDDATREIFGKNVAEEIRIAKKTLRDFSDYCLNIRRDEDKLKSELDACTKSGQVSRIMKRIRTEYL